MDAAMSAKMTANAKTHRIFAFSDNVEIFAATRAIFAAVFEKIGASQRAQDIQPQSLQRGESTRESQGESKGKSRGESALAKSKHELSLAKSPAPHKPSPAPRESSTRESGGESRPRESSQIDHSFHIDYFCAPASAPRFADYSEVAPLYLKTHAERLLDYDLGFSLHSAQIFPPKLVAKIPCINLHPGYNPHNRGIFPQVFSIINKKPIGATLHFMDASIDSGEVIAQKELRILPNDTSKSLYARIFAAEIALFQTHIEGILEGVLRGEIKPPKILAKSPANHAPHAALQGNYNSKADFRNLCKINLDAKLTMREALDYLRALSHEPYQNAYFVGESGEKYFVSLLISKAVGGAGRFGKWTRLWHAGLFGRSGFAKTLRRCWEKHRRIADLALAPLSFYCFFLFFTRLATRLAPLVIFTPSAVPHFAPRQPNV